MPRPRIVHVYKDMYPPVEGGVERIMYHMARMASEEFKVGVITAPGGMKTGHRTIDGRIDVTEVASLGRLQSTPIAPAFLTALRRSGADLFHFHFPHPMGEAAYLLSGLKTPAVATYHGDVVRQKAALMVYRPIMQRFLKRMQVIMPTTERFLGFSKDLRGHLDRCEVVNLGYPPDDYELDHVTGPMADEYKQKWGDFIFFIGCLRYYKGLRYAIDAMAELSSERPDAKLVIAGSGNEGAALKAQVESLGLADRVHFLGRVSDPEAVALLHAAKVFCLPACETAEVFGLCQIEAMFCGLPIVSTDLATGVPEVNQHEESGLIVPPENSAALAEALGRILGDDALHKKLSEGGRERALRLYTARTMGDHVCQIYRRVLAET